MVKQRLRAMCSASSVYTDALVISFSISLDKTIISAFVVKWLSRVTFFFCAANSFVSYLTIASRCSSSVAVDKE